CAHHHSHVAEKAIEQAGLAGISPSKNHHPHAFAQNPPLIGRGEQRRHFLADRIESCAQFFSFIWRDTFLWKINRYVDVRDQRNQFVAYLSNLLAESAFKLFGSGKQRETIGRASCREG